MWAAVYGAAQSRTLLKRLSSSSRKRRRGREGHEAGPTSLVAQTVKRLSTMWETRIGSLGREDPLEKEMAIHSSTIAWKVPWTEEPGGPQSTGLLRVGHNLKNSYLS